MGCTSCKQNQTIESTRYVKDVIKSKYKIERIISGDGLLGKVFIASIKDEPEQKVAIKAIAKKQMNLSNKDISAMKVLEEVKILEKLDHPNMCTYIESYETEKTIYIVMEYFEGTQLFDLMIQRVESKGSFNEREVCDIIKKILDVLKYCHSQEIMHKDLKPKKVLCDSNGNLKIVDFGLSKWDFFTTIQMMTGKTFYLAPEILKNDKTTKCDIWSVGVIMYSLLSGCLPFTSDTNQTVFQKAIKGEYSMESGVWDGISHQAKDLIQHMINIDVDKRYTAEDCLAHEWFTMEHQTIDDKKYSTGIVKNLKLMRSQTIMESAAQTLVKKKIEIQDIRGIRNELKKLCDEDGTVDSINFKKILLKFESSLTSEQADIIIKEILSTQKTSGRINYLEFIDELKSLHSYNSDTRMWLTFSKYINQESGHLPYSELQAAIGEVDSPRTKDDISQVCMILNISEDEEIDFVKFKEILKHKKHY
ncbi:unnamed protein product [Moneuplotes crassus]|uniref:Protein kinase domain-containing protein n=2 Tax=Euplotes crassus TaxID=5936 RepID=A0AAD1UF14_EUPCR|nr:unnamed protein product [Moneuplotes crassus]